MTGAVELVVAAASGGGGTLIFQGVAAWWKSRTEMRRDDREADARLEARRDKLTFDLLDAAGEWGAALRSELAELRPIIARVAHLDEALDHIHALLHAEGEAERRAAERRAKAFLRRMRPEIGDLRNSAQAATSAQRVARDIEEAGQ
ncbi:hypothetical protein [Rhizorhabdus histidinilytica]|uniref:hypothetical protein n=1 Tax=Rhizorhabdus histidinilytica TaxID=439228 RepID=UPI001115F20D|nr:hypothetical protein [Rhizorhabdus histidinilytica]